MLPYGEFADFTVRFLPVDAENDAWRDYQFFIKQLSAAPLSRLWRLVLPGLGLQAVA